jgi:hypothetical protein
MNLQDISVVVGFLVVFCGLAVAFFRTKSDCGNCQKSCRSEMYKVINSKADKADIEKLDDRYMEVALNLKEVSVKLDLILKGMIKGNERSI